MIRTNCSLAYFRGLRPLFGFAPKQTKGSPAWRTTYTVWHLQPPLLASTVKHGWHLEYILLQPSHLTFYTYKKIVQNKSSVNIELTSGYVDSFTNRVKLFVQCKTQLVSARFFNSIFTFLLLLPPLLLSRKYYVAERNLNFCLAHNLIWPLESPNIFTQSGWLFLIQPEPYFLAAVKIEESPWIALSLRNPQGERTSIRLFPNSSSLINHFEEVPVV